jgi:hypothetical protein
MYTGKSIPFPLSFQGPFPVRAGAPFHSFLLAGVGGIKVPQTSQVEDGGNHRISIQINVDYDESVFVKPPPIEAGPEAWRRKK